MYVQGTYHPEFSKTVENLYNKDGFLQF